MFPVPIVAASAVMKAWKGLSAPPPSDVEGTNERMASRKRATCTKRRRRVTKIAIPNSSRAKTGTSTPGPIVHGP